MFFHSDGEANVRARGTRVRPLRVPLLACGPGFSHRCHPRGFCHLASVTANAKLYVKEAAFLLGYILFFFHFLLLCFEKEGTQITNSLQTASLCSPALLVAVGCANEYLVTTLEGERCWLSIWGSEHLMQVGRTETPASARAGPR